MFADVTISTEIFALISGVGCVIVASSLAALGWLVLRVSQLSEDIAVIRTRLNSLPCGHCAAPTTEE